MSGVTSAASDMEQILHPVAISEVMLNFAAHYQVERQVCLAGTNIEPSLFLQSDGLITRAQEIQIIENIIQAIPNEPALGFKLGLQYNMATFGPWGFAMRTSKTLRQALQAALRFLPLSTAYCRMYWLEDGRHVGVVHDPSDIPISVRQFLLERDMATGINLLKELSLSGIGFSRVEFQGPPPAYADELEAHFGIKLQFHCSRNVSMVRAEDAERALPTYDPQLAELMQQQCKQQLQKRRQSGITGKVRQLLLGSLGLTASAEEVAAKLALSERSLRRKLEGEQTSFKHLVDEEREQFAKKLLAAGDMKLDEVAYHLGYTDTASFSRAFRRWQACSPGEYRRQIKSQNHS